MNDPAINKYLELEIKTLQNAPRDTGNLKTLLKAKEREKRSSQHLFEYYII
jgi:hypothetical protein